MTASYEMQEINDLIAALEAERAGHDFDADAASARASELMRRFPEIKVSMQLIVDRLSARKRVAA